MSIRRFVLWACAAALGLGAAQGAWAQDKPWPSKPIRFVIPFPPGGPTDSLSRQIASQLQEALGQTVVTENVAGVGGGLGLAAIASAPADGYTIGYGQTSNLAINPHLYPPSSLKYDPLKDFTPVAMLADAANVLIVNPKEPYKSLAELIQAAKARPGTIAYGSAGNGTGSHLGTELLASMTGTRFLHVPYKGFAAAETDLIAGNISFMFTNPMTALPFAKAGRVRALATAHRQRMDLDPSLPTVAETVPGYEVVSWAAIVAPAGLPKEITQRLTDEIARILRKPDVVERLTKQGWNIAYGTPEQTAQAIRKDLALWGPIVKSSGAKID